MKLSVEKKLGLLEKEEEIDKMLDFFEKNPSMMTPKRPIEMGMDGIVSITSVTKVRRKR